MEWDAMEKSVRSSISELGPLAWILAVPFFLIAETLVIVAEINKGPHMPYEWRFWLVPLMVLTPMFVGLSATWTARREPRRNEHRFNRVESKAVSLFGMQVLATYFAIIGVLKLVL